MWRSNQISVSDAIDNSNRYTIIKGNNEKHTILFIWMVGRFRIALAQVSSEVFREIDIPANPEDFAPYIGMGEDTYLGSFS